MFATLTSKGQLTLPKEIRDRLGLDAGSVLDFALQPDNTITARAVKPDARRIRGLLSSPHAKALTLDQQREAVGLFLKRKHAPAKHVRGAKSVRSAR
jgi:antitoxin PrlF